MSTILGSKLRMVAWLKSFPGTDTPPQYWVKMKKERGKKGCNFMKMWQRLEWFAFRCPRVQQDMHDHWYYMWKLLLYFPFESSSLPPLLGSASLISQQSQPSSVMFGLIWWSVPWHCLHSESTDALVLGISLTELSVWCELLIFNWADSMHHWCLESWQSRLMLMHQHV